MQLIIGNRNYSSWSLRAWLQLRCSDLEFDVLRIPLFVDAWDEKIRDFSPAGRVPILVDGSLTVWDSLAIMEHVAETRSTAVGWPRQPKLRAEARSISAEMHSGFLGIREQLPQNLRRDPAPVATSDGTRAQVDRVLAIWSSCRQRYARAGPWLFGPMSIADCMYAPVALRFHVYAVPVPQPARQFVDAVLDLAAVQEWIAACREEPEALDFIDRIEPADAGPMRLG